jgi:hypothetical protein
MSSTVDGRREQGAQTGDDLIEIVEVVLAGERARD